MKVLVTGNLGYLGSALSVELRDSGHEVEGVDDGSTAKVADVDGVSQWPSDIRQDSITETLVAVGGVDVVVHLAAVSGIARCAADPVRASEVNISATASIAEACAEHACPIIFASTIGLYGEPWRITDSTHRDAPTFYAQTKRAAEDVLAVLDCPALSFQMGNLYGTHTVDGETVSKGTVVNRFIDLARRGDPILVHEPGEQTRDFIHVDDVVAAYIAALDRIHDVDGLLSFRLASGDLTTVSNLAAWVADATGVEVETVDHPGEPRWVGDIDNERTEAYLGWEPQNDLETYVRGEL